MPALSCPVHIRNLADSEVGHGPQSSEVPPHTCPHALEASISAGSAPPTSHASWYLAASPKRHPEKMVSHVKLCKIQKARRATDKDLGETQGDEKKTDILDSDF